MSESVREPVKVIEEYLQAWNDHDGEAVRRSFVDGGTFLDPTLPEPVSGQGITHMVDEAVAAFPDMAFELVGTVSEGDRIVIEWRMTGTNTGPLASVPEATGRSIDLPGVGVITLGPDGIISHVDYWDRVALFQQLGLMPAAQ